MSESKATVLIVDDMPSNIKVLAACLSQTYSIKVATSGQQCFDIVKQSSDIDLILLDIEMPDLDGFQVCELLQKDTTAKDIPIIFITGKSDASEEEKGLALGAVDYITKPIRPAIVQARVKTHITLKHQRDKLVSMATIDQLTNIYNRHYLCNVGSQKISSARRHGLALCVLVIDLDFFKVVNDTHGHVVGDAVLAGLGALLLAMTRHEDVAARYGGEEFVVVLDHCGIEEARRKAEVLCAAVSGSPIGGVDVTCSIGVSELTHESDNITTLINRADVAMYRAKQNGRNGVQVEIVP